MNKINIKYLLILIFSTLLFACGGDDDNNDPESVFERLERNASFSILVQAIETAGLEETLNNLDSNFTIFAPNNEAFTNFLNEMGIDAATLLANPDLANILLYHVISGSIVDSATASDSVGMAIEMASGDNAIVSSVGPTLYINVSAITSIDMMADNGIIHTINKVMVVPAEQGTPTLNIVETAQADERFETLVTALTTANLVTALSNPDANFTVFAPTDDAFAALGQGTINALLNNVASLTDILEKHVIGGAAVDFLTALTLNGNEAETLGGENIMIQIGEGALTVGGANVVMSNLYTTNGIIHVIDTVIADELDLPPLSIVDVATNAGSFTTLLAALDAAELTSTVANLDNTFTVFAPTDEAFSNLLTALNIEAGDLLADPDLADILLYHVLNGSVDSTAATAAAGTTVATANGDSVGLSINNEALNVNTSTVTTADVSAANGIIHIVNQVLIPPSNTVVDGTIADAVVNDERFDTLEAAVIAADLAGALANTDATYTVFAPTDEAFAALLETLGITAEALLASEILLPTLQLHVVNGAAVDSVTAFSLSSTMVTTLGGAEIAIAIVDGQLTVGGAIVSSYDIVTDNGVIHVIDSVITQ